jgi:hypothetical protein
MVTGLPSATTFRFSVASQPGGCGTSAQSQTVTVTTPSGPAARPVAPTGLTVTGNMPSGNVTNVTLSWSQPASADPPVGYRLYEGATVLGTSQGTTTTLQLPSGPQHVVSVVAVDAAGNESAASAPVTFTAMYIPPP